MCYLNILGPFYRIYEWKLFHQIQNDKPPNHIGVILDGNRRYGKLVGIDPWKSHQIGAKKIEDFLGWCWRSGIKIVTLYSLSTDNLNRDSRELDEIFGIAKSMFERVIDDKDTHEYHVRVKAIGSISRLPPGLQEAIAHAEESTKSYSDYYLNIAIGYGGRTEILDAVRNIAQEVANDELSPSEIMISDIERYLYTAGLPDPDLILRTSGEERISGFLLWQSAYAEFYFCEVFWPLIRRIDLWRAIRIYQKRRRRFGK